MPKRKPLPNNLATAPRDGGHHVGRVPKREREVLDAAVGVFYKKGYSEASMQDIADELGMLRGSLYHYIKSKEELLIWLIDEVHSDVNEILRDAAAATELPPLERLAGWVRAQTLYNAHNIERIAVYNRDSDQLSETLRDELRQSRRKHEQVVVNMIAEAQELGQIPSTYKARYLSHHVYAPMIWIYKWYTRRSRQKPAELAEMSVDFVLAGVQGVGPDTSRTLSSTVHDEKHRA